MLHKGDIDFEHERAMMVTHDIRGRGVGDERVLDAMMKVKREEFVEPEYRRSAYGMNSEIP